MIYSCKTHELVSRTKEQKQGKGFRKHLGASVIGRECTRQLWYIFRWAKRSHFKARILRLFERGQREEAVLVDMLRKAGIHTLDVDPDTGQQFRIEDHDGHMGGSLDAKIFDCPDFPGILVLGEFKTHGDKSYKALIKQGLVKSKKEHEVQSQLYMAYTDLPYCLYIAVNKNDDSLDFTLLERDLSVAERYSDRALRVIQARTPPVRINDSPGWYQCRFCDYASVCHEGSKKELNCRTCINSVPIDNAEWWCDQFGVKISHETQLQGCQSWTEILES